MTHIFIVNPYAGNKVFAEQLRKQLSKIEGLRYFVFTTRYEGYEREIVRRVKNIFEDEELRIYSCGGSGTFRNVLNGIADIGQLENTEVAFYPCGLTNDFLKVFGDDLHQFNDIENLINGKVVSVDYMKTNKGVMINCLSAGLDARFQENMNKYRELQLFGKTLPYNLSILKAALGSRAKSYVVEIDGEIIEGRFSELVFGNGFVFGGDMYYTDKADVTDGLASYIIVPKLNLFRIVRIFAALSSGNITSVRKQTINGEAKHIIIRQKDKMPCGVNQDGELEFSNEWDIRIVKQGLKFVVPRGIDV